MDRFRLGHIEYITNKWYIKLYENAIGIPYYISLREKNLY